MGTWRGHCRCRSYTVTLFGVFILNGILLVLYQDIKEAKASFAADSNNFKSMKDPGDWHNRTQLSDAVIVSKSSGHLHEILPPWEDTVEINEGIHIHRHPQLTEELTESILWRARQQKMLRKSIKVKYSQQKERNPPKYNLTIFTLNYNAGPVQAVRHLLEP